jgi:hypothetical protein
MNLNDIVLVSKNDILVQTTRFEAEREDFKGFFLGTALSAMMACEKDQLIKNHFIGNYSIDYVKASVNEVLKFFGFTENQEEGKIFLTDDLPEQGYVLYPYNNMIFVHLSNTQEEVRKQKGAEFFKQWIKEEHNPTVIYAVLQYLGFNTIQSIIQHFVLESTDANYKESFKKIIEACKATDYDTVNCMCMLMLLKSPEIVLKNGEDLLEAKKQIDSL